MTTTTFSTSSPFAAGPTSMSSITSSTYPNIPEPSPTGLPPGPSIKTVTQTSTAQSPDSSSQSLSAGAEEPGRGLAVGPPGAFSDSAVSPPSNNMTVGMDGTGTNGTNGTVHHMTRLWNCTIIPSPSNSTGSGVDGTANCTLLDIANLADTNGTHANSTQLALESLISGNKTSSPSSPLPSTSSSNSNSTATVGVPEEDEVEEEWEIVYECDEYEPSPNTTTTPSPSPSASSSSAPSLKQAEVAAFSSHETSPAPVPAGQGSNGTIPLTPSPVNVSPISPLHCRLLCPSCLQRLLISFSPRTAEYRPHLANQAEVRWTK